MSESVNVRNFDELLNGYQKSGMDSSWYPGLISYLETIEKQNEEIIKLLTSILYNIARDKSEVIND